MAVRPSVDRHRGRNASGMPDPEVRVYRWVDFCLSGLLDDQKIKIEKTMRKENGFVKRWFTHPLAPQVIYRR